MNAFAQHLVQLDAFASADPFQNFGPCFEIIVGLHQTIASEIERFWDMPGTNGVAASEACPNCRTRNADDLAIVETFAMSAIVRCSCGHSYEIEDQFSN